ncbi:MAG: transporter substrate-binding domain-containing protein [Desulfovibrio sp.]|jgi:polar amino acid transport system substrate-binding protein|nr:transporter substrate-binding domain-containing protein [Desulfovibrio sp.]
MAVCAVLALVCVLAPGAHGARAAQEADAAVRQAMGSSQDVVKQDTARQAVAGEAEASAAGPADSASAGPELRIGFSTSSLPYVDMVNKNGLEPRLVAAALDRSGYRVVPVFLPHARALELVRKGTLDGCGPVGRHADVAGLALGDMYLQYRNVAVSLEAAGLEINTLADLRGLPVTAFHNARVFMGPDFAAMADANPRYEEQVDQRAQVEAFFQRRDRVIVLDERIFAFHRARLAARGVTAPVRVHRIFPAQDRFFVFRDPAVRDAFDAGLRQLQESGEFRRMVR